MRFPHQISISADTGVGKTKLLEELKKHLTDPRYRWVSVGDFMRERANLFGMTIDEFAKHNRLHPEERHDQWCDQQIEQMAREDYMVCFGRIPHRFMPRAFHVLLTCDPRVRAQRRQQDFPKLGFEEVLRRINERDANDKSRYRELYPDAFWCRDKYHLVIDTERHSPLSEAKLLLTHHGQWQMEFVA